MDTEAILEAENRFIGIGLTGKDLVCQCLEGSIEPFLKVLQLRLPQGAMGLTALAFNENPALLHPTIGGTGLP